MRNTILLFKLLSISVILFACDKKNDEKSRQDQSAFIFKAIKDSESWVATRTWGYYSKRNNEFTLTGALVDPYYYQEEDLNIFIKKGKIVVGEKLRDFEAQLSFIVGGDGVVWRYEKTGNMEESYLKINKLDTINNRISGEFEIRLKDARSLEDYYINLTNGEFNLSYDDRD